MLHSYMIRTYSERRHLGLQEYVVFEKSNFLKKIDFLRGRVPLICRLIINLHLLDHRSTSMTLIGNPIEINQTTFWIKLILILKSLPLNKLKHVTLLTESIVTATRSSILTKNETLARSKISNVTKKLIESKHRAYRQWKKKQWLSSSIVIIHWLLDVFLLFRIVETCFPDSLFCLWWLFFNNIIIFIIWTFIFS